MSTTYLPRTSWTSAPASGERLTGSELVGVAVHWPGTTQDVIGDPGQAGIAARLRHYRSYHLGRGWQDIGYNVAIDQAGRVWMLRSTAWQGNMVGAHCASLRNPRANHKYVGVLLVLGDREPLSGAMIEAFRHWYHNHFLRVWRDRTDVRGHGQVAGAQTSCPGPYARAVLGNLVESPDPGSETEDDEMSVDIVRIGVHGIIDEAAQRSTPTGRQLGDDLHKIIKQAVVDALREEREAQQQDPS